MKRGLHIPPSPDPLTYLVNPDILKVGDLVETSFGDEGVIVGIDVQLWAAPYRVQIVNPKSPFFNRGDMEVTLRKYIRKIEKINPL